MVPVSAVKYYNLGTVAQESLIKLATSKIHTLKSF